jgi:hypothetical protein
MAKHINAPICESCAEKLKQADPYMAKWFNECVKPAHIDSHVCWAFRDKDNQNDAFAEGKSKCLWPRSPHNKTDDTGKPCSKALDLFRLVDGKALFPKNWYQDIASCSKNAGWMIKWGGDFASLSDYDHFEMAVNTTKKG